MHGYEQCDLIDITIRPESGLTLGKMAARHGGMHKCPAEVFTIATMNAQEMLHAIKRVVEFTPGARIGCHGDIDRTLQFSILFSGATGLQEVVDKLNQAVEAFNVPPLSKRLVNDGVRPSPFVAGTTYR